jgi:hypothetical protein
MSEQYVPCEEVRLKGHPVFNEGWLKERIVDDTSILGLGDVERKRYSQYDHCAVIIAEDITTRFLNVIGLFNNAIPIIAIQLRALKVGEQLILHFTKVLDLIEPPAPPDEEGPGPDVTREDWEKRASKDTLAVADECLATLQEIDPGIRLTYRKFFVGLSLRDHPNNFVYFVPKKQFAKANVRIAQATQRDDWEKTLREAGLRVRSLVAEKRIELQLTRPEVPKHRDLLKKLFQVSYNEWFEIRADSEPK